ncbi:hypothetical protein AN3421.2 [Paecilomyces variotii No. 5]|uniref:Nucleoside-diphosphate-sugar epimerase n=1 Tax=Byssochlamys spectabilis (strain No. 5 / NBRC 109023) TaxID=1356009 RepID=V5G2B2_BYSSN|nr:hypothetical protein AN3421.2 [Paecilomyces variotii No. 5]
MHLILTGATGLVGSAALAHILSLPPGSVSRLSILSRRPVPMAENKPNVTVIEHRDFSQYPPELLEKLKGANGVIWAQGISQTEVPKDEYIKITLDYPLAAAKAFSGLSDSFKFVYVSGEGATTEPGFMTPLFGTVKGQAEEALLKLSKETPTFKPYSVRPAFIDAHNHPEVQKAISSRANQQTFAKKAVNAGLGPVMRCLYPGIVSPTPDLGRFLTDLAMGDGKPLSGDGVSGEGRTVSNKAFRRIAKVGA